EPDSASAEGSGETRPPRDFKSFINSTSLEVANAKCEPAVANARLEERYQFERLGYFTLDPDSISEKQVWNRTVTLRDTWAKAAQKYGSARGSRAVFGRWTNTFVTGVVFPRAWHSIVRKRCREEVHGGPP